MDKALLIVCHGSKRNRSREEFDSLIEKIRKINQKNKNISESDLSEAGKNLDGEKNYLKIAAAYLEFADPQLETAVKSLYQEGIKEIDISPLFILAGYHLNQDLPLRMEKLAAELKDLNYNILKHPAYYDDFAEYIFNKALQESSGS